MKKLSHPARALALLTAGALSFGVLLQPTTAHADKAQTYRNGAIAMGALGAYLFSKGKGDEAALALGVGAYAYKKGEDARRANDSNDRFGNRNNFDPRYDDPRYDPRYDDPRYDARYDPRYDPRYDDPRYDARYDPRYDPRYDDGYGNGGFPNQGGYYGGGYDPRFPNQGGRNNQGGFNIGDIFRLPIGNFLDEGDGNRNSNLQLPRPDDLNRDNRNFDNARNDDRRADESKTLLR